MPLNKVHKRRNNVAANLPRQLLGGTTTTHAASSTVVSTNHGMQPPTGPPLYITTTSAGASTTSPGTTGTGTATGTDSLQTTATVTDTSVATSNTSGGGAAAFTQATSGGAFTQATGSRTVTTRAIASTSSSSASASSTSGDSSGPGLGSIAGAAAAAVIGIGIIAAFFVWFIRRKKKNSDPDEEPFNRNSFLRQSAVIPDTDGPVPSRTRASPPPPPMAERQPMYGSTATFDTNQSGFGYNTQPSYSAGQLYAPNAANPFGPGGAPATPLPASPGFGTAYEQPGFNNGGYSDLTRGSVVQDFPPSHGPMSPPLDNPHSPNYPGPETFPVPQEPIPNHDMHSTGPEPVSGMYAQPGFPELTPATASAQQGHVVAVSNSVHDGRETPVQLGFAPVQMPTANQTQPAQPGNKGKINRPETMYDDQDAYGGI